MSEGLEEVVDTIKQLHKAEIISVAPQPSVNDLIVLPKDMTVRNVRDLTDKYLPKPDRKVGDFGFSTLPSLALFVKDHMDADSIALQEQESGQLRVVLDFHQKGENMTAARHADFSAFYIPKKSDEWEAWSKRAGNDLDQGPLAEMIYERAHDFARTGELGESPGDLEMKYLLGLHKGKIASPQQMLEIAGGLSFRREHIGSEKRNPHTGEVELIYVEKDGDTPEVLKLTNFFILHIPVFRFGDPYKIGGHLTYSVRSGKVRWKYRLLRLDETYQMALADQRDAFTELTGLPVLCA